MVNFKADHAHFSSSMCMINTFRKDSSLCDVNLIIGNQSLQAHRCVLAAGSPYFRSLFLGQFTEANMKEINLSEVTSSITALERIVQFVYTGEIDINEDTLGETIKLSSFFLIESLNTFCCTYMTDTLSLTTCLRYYLYSVGHGISDIIKKSRSMVMSRFHDHLIYEEDTLLISTDEMQFLFKNDILQHCSTVSIVRFIALWVIKGLTERHMIIAKEIFDSLVDRVNSPKICSLQLPHELSLNSLYEMTESSLSDLKTENKDMFLQYLKRIIGKLITENEMANLETKCRPCKETVIIAVFPSNDVMEVNRKLKNTPYDREQAFDELSTNGPILYLCAYIPRTRLWYIIKKIIKDGGTFASLIDLRWFGVCRFDALQDILVFINIGSEQIIINDLNDLENLELNLLPSYDFLENEVCKLPNDLNYDICLAAGSSNSGYLVAKFRRFVSNVSESVLGIYFNGYKLHEGKTWKLLFQTELIPVQSSDEWDCGFSKLYAQISTISNEMIVVHFGDDIDVVFVVDLNTDNVRPLIVLSSEIDNQKYIRKGIHIIEGNDAMYIVTDGTTYIGEDSGNVMVMYEYRLRSKQLTEINSTVVNVDQLQENTHERGVYPCNTKSSASVEDGMWFMEGNDNQASSLIKVTVDDNKTPVIEYHTPPPFPSITAMFASKISSQILDNKELVTRYFGNEQPRKLF